MSGPDYIVDIDGLRPSPRKDNGGKLHGRPWLSVRWRCCGTYSRVYRNDDATAYEGGCPGCGRKIKAPIGPNGTSSRFFEAS